MLRHGELDWEVQRGSGGTIGSYILSWKDGCVGIGRRRQPANPKGNAVEPDIEKTRANAKDGDRKRESPGKMFFLYK